MSLRWKPIIEEAARIADSYMTAVTLRQLHYRLVAGNVGGYRNTLNHYKRLSELSAEARRQGTFPALSDFTRGIERALCFDTPTEAVEWVSDRYRRDRTEGQENQVWCLFEKATLGAQIESWTRPLGIPSAALRGYSSESLEREVFEAMEDDGRPVVVFYVGDLDPEGEDIERNFGAQFDRRNEDIGIEIAAWKRLTVTLTQATSGLAGNFNPGKSKSSRAAGFVRKYGRLFQIEVEALDPALLEQLVMDAITDPTYFHRGRYNALIRLEEVERERLKKVAKSKTLRPKP